MSSTRTEAIFAALQGPVLSLSSPVVCMYRSYTLELLLPRRWRLSRGLSASALCSALAGAQVVRADAPAGPAVRCDVCGPVLSLADVRSNPSGVPDDLESFCASVRARCSSSRRHLRVRELAVVVELAPGVTAASSPFTVCARDRTRGRQQQQQKQQQTQSPSLPPLAASSSSSSAATPAVGGAWDVGALAMAGPLQGGQGFYLVVEVMRPVMPLVVHPDCGQAMSQGLVSLLQTVPGFLMQKTSCSMELYIVIRAFRTVEDAEQARQIAQKYSRNIIRNVVNMDVVGAVVKLATVRSW
eukprot:m51a1_g6179 hypothetical protein (299) ;mRNA; f:30449-31514